MLTRSLKYAKILPPYNKNNKVGRKMKSQPPSFPLKHDSFHKIRTPRADKHDGLVEIGLPLI